MLSSTSKIGPGNMRLHGHGHMLILVPALLSGKLEHYVESTVSHILFEDCPLLCGCMLFQKDRRVHLYQDTSQSLSGIVMREPGGQWAGMELGW